MSKMSNRMRHFGIALSAAAIAVPHPVAVAQTSTPAVQAAPAEDLAPVLDEDVTPVEEIIDFRMGAGGLFVGEVRNQAGKLMAGRTVRVLFEGTEVATTRTDSGGMFRVLGLREGLHEVEVCNSTKRYRFWAEESAPPDSEQSAKLVCFEEVAAAPRPVRQVARPRRFPRLAAAFATYPIATAALVGAGIGSAIAIPIATSGGVKPASP